VLTYSENGATFPNHGMGFMAASPLSLMRQAKNESVSLDLIDSYGKRSIGSKETLFGTMQSRSEGEGRSDVLNTRQGY
jgi:hypothetical protein